jgi:hypothetical protein
MTTRIDTRFEKLKAEGRPALVTYFMGGDPDYETSLKIMQALPGAGSDVIELGMPFSDPMADGPAIQMAGQRALKGGQNAEEDTVAGVGFPQGRQRDADRADGLLQSDLHLRRRTLSGRRHRGGHRRADRGRSAAGNGRGTVPAGAEGRHQLHPACDPDHGRQAVCRWCSPTRRVSSTTFR